RSKLNSPNRIGYQRKAPPMPPHRGIGVEQVAIEVEPPKPGRKRVVGIGLFEPEIFVLGNDEAHRPLKAGSRIVVEVKLYRVASVNDLHTLEGRNNFLPRLKVLKLTANVERHSCAGWSASATQENPLT